MTISRDHLLDWLTLHLTEGLGAAGCRRLVGHFHGPAGVFAAPAAELLAVPGIKRPALEAVLQRQARPKAAGELARLEASGIDLIPWDDPRYPARLRDIPHPPALLYVKGDGGCLNAPCLAMVGSRAATSYGRRIAGQLARTLAGRGFTVVSGLALGIDAEAHQGALAAGGRTIAVLGCGLNLIYPSDNQRLFKAIPEAGAIVSEYPLDTKPDGFRFPARNRIISGLSLGVIVVEATPRSGSLITAQHALEQGREVFAVPGQMDSIKSAGSHHLLQQGAKLVMSVEDILAELPPLEGYGGAGPATLPGIPAEPLSPEEQQLHNCLDDYPRTIDEIVRDSGLSAAKVNELLLHLELKGAVEAMPGKNYRRV